MGCPWLRDELDLCSLEVIVTKKNLPVLLLAIALIGSNAYWTYRFIDLGITHSYTQQEHEEANEALSEALALIKAEGSPDVSRERLIAAAKSISGGEPFEKDGCVYVGRLGLRFSPDGRLVDAAISC
jgi:hypothetical protein